MAWLIALAIVAVVLVSGLAWGRMAVKEIPVMASLAALAAVTRVPLAALPGVQPTTFFVAAAGWVMGGRAGFIVGSLAAFLSNLFLGQGPWTPWQMLAWGLVGLSAGWLGRLYREPDRFLLAIFLGLWGYLFGAIMDVWHWLTFIFPLTWTGFLATWAAGFWFDTAHAAGNIVLALAFGPGCLAIIRRFQERLRVTYEVREGVDFGEQVEGERRD